MLDTPLPAAGRFKIRKSEFTLALRGKSTYYALLMRLNALLIISLLVIVIVAPIVDAVACDDCKHVLPFRDTQQHVTNGADLSVDSPLLSEKDHPEQRETGSTQDLCPVCANIAAAMGIATSSMPSMISQTNHLPRLIALSDPAYSITKPPQN